MTDTTNTTAEQTHSETHPDDVRRAVRAKYAEIATGEAGASCGPSCGCGDSGATDMIGDEYDDVAGYVENADLKLGCGVPTDLANLQPGDAVLDLGSGAGLDAFVARREVGASGRVEGVDFTPEMVEKARANTRDLGYDNVHFHEGDIEDLPLADERFDVVISNCVLNLVPDKPRAFAEMYRVLRPGGRFCVSDVVVRGALPDGVRRSAELYAGCVAGAMDADAYLDGLREAGFENVEIAREREVDVPDAALAEAAGEEAIQAFRDRGAILSVTVRGVKS